MTAGCAEASCPSAGPHCFVHRSEDAANYLRDVEGLDLPYARQPAARQLLVEATARDTPTGRLRLISAEGLIGLQLQAFANNPKRTRDLEDIRALLRAQRGRLDLVEVREYLMLFERQELLDELLAEAAPDYE